MKPEAQRIAIGEYCHDHSQDRFTHWTDGEYLADLNAMHEAEKVLKNKHEFLCELELLLGYNSGPGSWDMDVESLWAMVNATASQRAEAFLRTIGKWEE